jgi:hypothetical protein
MTSKPQIEKWVTVLLGGVCLILALNLAFRGGVKVLGTRPTVAALKPSSGGRVRSTLPRDPDELARYDPSVRTDRLNEIQSRPAPKVARNPFEFVVKEAPPKAQEVAAGGAPAQPAPPSSPPPPALKALGYSEKGGGVREAIVSLEDQIFVIHEGETFAKRFKVLRITTNQVEVSDETTQQNIRLPFG